MSTNIEWADETWPVVTGCTPVSEGCHNCYAARMAATRLKHHPRYEGLATIENGRAKWTGEVRLNPDVLEQPLHWRKPRMVFVASMGDWLHPSVPDLVTYRVLDTTQEAPQHTYQFLTKRADRLPIVTKRWLLGRGLHEPPSNVWQGVSVENQAAADERIPWLLQTPAAVRFVSVEPMLGAINVTPWLRECGGGSFPIGLPLHQPLLPRNWHQPALSWVICGGESGPGARPMHPDWARSLRDQCQAAGVPFFFKQWGEFVPESHWKDLTMIQRNRKGAIFSFRDRRFPRDQRMYRVGKKAAGHLLDSRTWQEFPGRK